jgi:hypothetical protein
MLVANYGRGAEVDNLYALAMDYLKMDIILQAATLKTGLRL